VTILYKILQGFRVVCILSYPFSSTDNVLVCQHFREPTVFIFKIKSLKTGLSPMLTLPDNKTLWIYKQGDCIHSKGTAILVLRQ